MEAASTEPATQGVDLIAIRRHDPGFERRPAVGIECRLGDNLLHDRISFPHFPSILIGGQVVGIQQRRIAWIGRTQAEAAAARLAHGAGCNAKAVNVTPGDPTLEAHGKEMELNVRVGNARPRAQECSDMALIAGGEAGAEQQPLKSDASYSVGAEQAVDRDRLLALPLQVQLDMIVEISAYARKLLDGLDADAAQVVRRPNPRKQQQVRRADCARTEDYLCLSGDAQSLAMLHELDRHRSVVFEDEAAHHGPALHIEIGLSPPLLDIGKIGARSIAAVDVHIESGEAFLVPSVHVFSERVASLPAGFQEGLVESVQPLLSAHADGPLVATVSCGAP